MNIGPRIPLPWPAIITAKNNDGGFDTDLVNHDNHAVVDFDGLRLVSRKRRRIKKSVVSEVVENPLRNGMLEEVSALREQG